MFKLFKSHLQSIFKVSFVCALTLSCAQSTYVLDLSQNKGRPAPKMGNEKFDTLRQSLATVEHSLKMSVTDIRSKKENTLGSAYTGVQYSKTPIIVEKNLSYYVEDYFEEYFTNLGLVLNKNNGQIPITVTINKFDLSESIEKFSLEKVKCEFNIDLDSRFKDKSFKANYWVDYLSSGDLGDGTKKIRPTFWACLELMLKKVMKDQKFIDYLNDRL